MDQMNASASKAFSVTIQPAVRVTTTTLRPLKANTSYTTTLAATGGKPPYTWSLAGGSLPDGLNLSATGVMSGTSAGLGVSAFTVRATDVLGSFDDQALQLAVNLGPLSATCAPPIGEVGVAYSQTACVPKLGLPLHVRPPERHHLGRHHAERRLHAERHAQRRRQQAIRDARGRTAAGCSSTWARHRPCCPRCGSRRPRCGH